MSFNETNVVPPGAKIKVIGVGGGGGNAVNTMIRSEFEGVDFIVCNTDVQALKFSLANNRIQIGKDLTRGLGAGADPDVGREAAMEDRDEIAQLLSGADMVFITAGMGGGTGTGAAAVVAEIARELGALTVAVVTKPFTFEGKRRRRYAEEGIKRLRESVDTLITIPNQRLLLVGSEDLSMVDAFKMADAVLVNAVRGISDIINIPGTVNVDFADVKTVMSCMGQALMGIGMAYGHNRAADAARMAICSPLLEDIDIEGATGILINITAGHNVKLQEISDACGVIQEAAHEDANIIFGAVIDESLGEEIRVTVIATGFPVDKDDEVLFTKPRIKPSSVKSEVQSAKGGYESAKANTAQSTQESVYESSHQSTNTTDITEDFVESESIKQDFNSNSGSTFEREVHELTKWTLGTINSEEISSAVEEIPSLALDNLLTQEVFENEGIQSMPQANDQIIEAKEVDNGDKPRSGGVVINDPKDDFVASVASIIGDIGLHDVLYQEEENLQEATSPEAPKMESLSSEETDSIKEIENRIEAAFAMAERLKALENAHKDDDLDIPAFLRTSRPDISLG